jgi:ABC-type phosphate/phosphonate transport system substrate-binding protein
MRLALAQQTADLAAYVEESIGRPLAAGLAIDSVGAVQAGIAAAQAGPMAWAGPLDAVMVHGGQASAWSEALARLDPEGRLVARQAVVQAEDLVFLGLRVLAESS